MYGPRGGRTAKVTKMKITIRPDRISSGLREFIEALLKTKSTSARRRPVNSPIQMEKLRDRQLRARCRYRNTHGASKRSLSGAISRRSSTPTDNV
jgi:hypothetical protein